MIIGKLYIGRKVRKIREEKKLTQAQFAERIGISNSYVNQIENNQRPVSAAVLLSLAEKFQIDISQLSSSEDDRLFSALTETLLDPLFENKPVALQELRIVTQNAPSMAHALIETYNAYKLATKQLNNFNGKLGEDNFPELGPQEEVRDFFYFIDNYIDTLDKSAENLAESIFIGESRNHSALVKFLQEKYDLSFAFSLIDNDILRHYDPISRTLTLNPYATIEKRTFQLAVQVAQLFAKDMIRDIVKTANFKSNSAKEICTLSLYNYFAGALLLPYRVFLQTAKSMRHDIELLSARFGVSIEQVCHRLATLQRPDMKGVPFVFARVDRAGNLNKRHSAVKLQFARLGSTCPLWIVHKAFDKPDTIVLQLDEMPNGSRFLVVAIQVAKGNVGYNKKNPQYAVALACEISNAASFVYADNLDIHNKANYAQVGLSCRICPRTKCFSRAFPSINQRLKIDHNQRGILPYEVE